MKKAGIIAWVGAGLMALGAAMVPWPFSGDTAIRILEGQLGRAGLSVDAATGGHLTLLPVPRIDLSGITIRDGDGDVSVRAETLRAAIRLGSLIDGETQVADITLVRPRIGLRPALAWGVLQQSAGLVPSAETGLRRAGVLSAGLRRIVLIDGSVEAPAGGDPGVPMATGINAVLSASSAQGYDLSATLQLRGQPVEISGSGLRLARSPEDGEHPLELVVASPLVNARIAGRSTGGPNAQTDGELLLKAPSVERLSQWIEGAPRLPIALAGPLELAGTLRLQPGMASLTNARFALASGHFDGVVTLRRTGDRLALDGTVAAETLDLTGALSPFIPLAGSEGWSSQPYAEGLLPRGDADLRISAGKLVIGRMTLSNAALSVLTHPGRVDAVLSNADFYKGVVKSRVSVSPSARGLDFRFASSFERVDAAAALAAFSDQKALSGTASGIVQVEGSGENALQLMQSLEGKASANIRQGEIVGLNLPDLLKRMERRPLLPGPEARAGRTSVDTGAIAARISRGVADVSEASINAPGARILLAGQIGLAERQLNLRGAAQTGLVTGEPEPAPLPFGIVGSFEAPLFLPNPAGRSGAAEPPAFQPRQALSGPLGSVAPVAAPGR